MAGMKIKKYEVTDMREALRMIKEELGSDAVILSTRKVMKTNNFGLFARAVIEVTAAVDENATKKQPKKAQKAQPIEDVEYVSAYAQKPKPKKQAVAKPVKQSKPIMLEEDYTPSEELLEQAIRKNKQAHSSAPRTIYDEFPLDEDDLYTDDLYIDDTPPSRVELAQPAVKPAYKPKAEPAYMPRKEPQVQPQPQQTAAPSMEQMAAMVSALGLDKLPAMLSEIGDLKRELKAMKTSISDSNNIMIDLTPKLKEYHAMMVKNGVDDVIAYRALKNIERSTSNKMSQAQLKSLVMDSLAKMVKVEPDYVDIMQRRIIAFAGPTGVGKTTTIAKVAATMTLKHGLRVCLITLDNFRIGAVEQLKTYAEIVKIPLYVASSPGELRKILQDTRTIYDCILIDSMGRSQYDVTQIASIRDFTTVSDEISVSLVLSMASNPLEMLDIVERYSELSPEYLVFTKLDETKYYGPLFNIPIKKKVPMLLFTTGQNVPDDMESPDGKKIAKKILQDIPSVWSN